LKNEVPKWRSVSSMVMAPARTGSDNSSRKHRDQDRPHEQRILCRVMPGARMLKMVVMKLSAPRIEDARRYAARRWQGPWQDRASRWWKVGA